MRRVVTRLKGPSKRRIVARLERVVGELHVSANSILYPGRAYYQVRNVPQVRVALRKEDRTFVAFLTLLSS